MRQRVPSRAWYSPGRPGRRPRVLIEDDDPALAVSDFSRFAQAGFDVAYCSGPASAPGDCPVLQGRRCNLLAGADAVLHRLDPGWGAAAAIRRLYPGMTVVVPQEPGADGQPAAVPDGCLPIPGTTSVPGQIAALRQARPQERPGPAAPRSPRLAAPGPHPPVTAAPRPHPPVTAPRPAAPRPQTPVRPA
jgi:hypothetical protein